MRQQNQKMSLQKLPPVSFKNTIEKHEIANRMYYHKKRLLELQLKQPKQGHSEAFIQSYKNLLEQNPKKNYFLQSKYTEIQRENRILFEKISKISRKKKKSQQGIDRARSLNITFRKKQIQEIENQNVRMYNRILQQKAFISFKDTDKQFANTKRMSNRISQKSKHQIGDWY